MTITVHGPIAHEQSLCRWHEEPRLEQRANGALVAHPGQTRISLESGDDYADTHPRPIPIHINHGGPQIGEVVYLRRKKGRLDVVGVIHDVGALDRLPEGPFYWSSGTLGPRSGGELQLRECSITTAPATVALQPLRIRPGDILTGSGWNPLSDHGMAMAGDRILVEARSATRTVRGRYGRTLDVVDDGPPEPIATPATRATALRSGMPTRLPDGTRGELLIHGGGRILNVR